MWISDGWEEYELLDCSGGERLERWGRYTLVRPDPQVVWDMPRKHPGWREPCGKYLRSSSGGGRWEVRNLPERWKIGCGGLTFNVGPMNFKHTGLFPEQKSNWEFITSAVMNANRPVSVLNLFAYTGAATLFAASAGASVCHVDAANGMVSWARENAKLSGLSGAPVRWIVDDCVKFVERELRRGRRYDAIIMDPPSYGRGPSGEIWKLEDSLWDFLKLVRRIMSDDPLFILVSSYSTGLSPSVLSYMCDDLFAGIMGGKSESGELGLRVSSTGLSLPCGSSCRLLRTGR